MARLTHVTYCCQRESLRETWTFNQRVFSLLVPREQWDLHNFYLLTQEMTNAELRLHRRVVKRVDPSLPQRAGRARLARNVCSIASVDETAETSAMAPQSGTCPATIRCWRASASRRMAGRGKSPT
jgi:hypothetical protein